MFIHRLWSGPAGLSLDDIFRYARLGNGGDEKHSEANAGPKIGDLLGLPRPANTEHNIRLRRRLK